jgi:hypothetical protein
MADIALPDYNGNTTIDVDPSLLGGPLLAQLKEVQDNVLQILKDVNDTFNDLKLGWVGSTAQAVDDWNQQWQGNIHGLFGKEGADPNKMPPAGEAYFGKIIYYVESAADNLTNASDSVEELFTPYLNMSGGGVAPVGPQNPSTPSTPAPSDIV